MRLPFRSLAAAIMVAALSAACGGGQGAAPKSDESLSPEAAAFRDLGLKGADAIFRAAYKVVADAESSEVIVAQRPPRRSFRVTMGRESLIIATEAGDVVTCGEEKCFRIPGLGSSLGAAGAAILGPLAEGFDMFHGVRNLEGFESKPDRTIAGHAATCASWKPDFAPDGFTMCLDQETGAPLSYEIATGNIAVTLEATKVDAPADDDFKPMFPVTDLPTGYVPPT